MSERADGSHYRHGRMTLTFPASARRGDRGTLVYRFRAFDGVGDLPVAAANCRIPATPAAVALMHRQFGVSPGTPPGRGSRGDGSATTLSCVVGGTCVLDGITVIGTPSGGGWGGGGGGCEWWNCDDGSMGDDYNSGWDPGTPPPPPTLDDDFVTDTIPPNCAQPGPAQEYAYCNSAAPEKGSELERTVREAIGRIRGRGGPCIEIAVRADSLLSVGKVRFFDGTAQPILYGEASGFGGWFGALLDGPYWLSFVGSRDPAGRTFDTALAHEVEHNLGRSHVPGTNPPTTPNALPCGG